MTKYKPSERAMIKYPSLEYRENILNANLIRTYDNSASEREAHDEAIRKVRELTLNERIERFAEIYGEEDYGERRGRGTYRR
jgi:hypothetical protein